MNDAIARPAARPDDTPSQAHPMLYAVCDALENVVALVQQGDDWVLVIPRGFDVVAAATIALQSLRAHIPAAVADALRAAALGLGGAA
jgi:hypothetical protein